MDVKTKKKLEASGWRVADAKDFLQLSDDEAGFIELKLALAQDLRTRRLARGLNQTQVANLIGSSQSRVAKMEAADTSVSVDLLVRSAAQARCRPQRCCEGCVTRSDSSCDMTFNCTAHPLDLLKRILDQGRTAARTTSGVIRMF